MKCASVTLYDRKACQHKSITWTIDSETNISPPFLFLLVSTLIVHHHPHMDLFLVPDNPLRTVLVSANGVAHYQITTTKVHGHRKMSRIQRPAESEADSVVAEIEWKNWDNPTIVRSSNLRGLSGSGVLATDFLHRRGPFSS